MGGKQNEWWRDGYLLNQNFLLILVVKNKSDFSCGFMWKYISIKKIVELVMFIAKLYNYHCVKIILITCQWPTQCDLSK